MKVEELISLLAKMPSGTEVGVYDGYLFPADIEKVELEIIENEEFVVFYS